MQVCIGIGFFDEKRIEMGTDGAEVVWSGLVWLRSLSGGLLWMCELGCGGQDGGF